MGRLVRTVELTPEGGPGDRVLEMGAYLQITPALRRFRGYGEVRGCYLGPLGKTDEKVARSKTGEEFRCSIDLFNAERDVFPYPDGHFKTIVCAELLEHLSEDPMHLMSEANRILPDGGYFILSTPNICSFRGVSAVLRGEHPGVFQQYMKGRAADLHEPRHAREYAPREVPRLFEAAGFATELLETGPYAMEWPETEPGIPELLRNHGFSADFGGETIHAVGRKTGPVSNRYPHWLYE
jgi:SAM-dependent methyltransferase